MGQARVVRPDRSQLHWDLVDLDAWLPPDHRARLVWAFVEGRIASPEMFPKLELLPHLKCSRPGRDRRDRDEAGQHGDAG